MIFIGTAAWSVPRNVADQFTGEGTHLQRYARVLNCAEINSSFYRSHTIKVYARWAASTPDAFKFAVKIPRSITHEARLRKVHIPLTQFLGEIKGLGDKLGPLLIQLPPSLAFDARTATQFFSMLREQHAGAIVCEPRHITWFDARVENLLIEHRIGRVAADPALIPAAAEPGGWTKQAIYYRLHGSPRMYWSNYSLERLEAWAALAQQKNRKTQTWFIFDNTAAGCAIVNALQLMAI